MLVAVALLSLAPSCATSGQPATRQRSAYELALPSASGEGLYDFSRLSRRPAAIYFFATWCLPCLQELKTLSTLQHKYEAKGFEVVAVGVDLEGAKVLTPFAQASNLPFPVLVATPQLRSGASPYGLVRSVPTTVLLDRKGKVAAAYEGPADPLELDRAVDELTR